MKRLLLAIVVLLFIVGDANAWPHRRSYSYEYSSYSLTVKIDNEKKFHDNTLSVQDIAFIRAAWMAHFDMLSHSIHYYHKNCPSWQGYGASGEGIGCGGPKCSTCVVGSTVIADAEVKSKAGRTYRVRLFR